MATQCDVLSTHAYVSLLDELSPESRAWIVALIGSLHRIEHPVGLVQPRVVPFVARPSQQTLPATRVIDRQIKTAT